MSRLWQNFSDAIYGKGKSYVSEERLNKMLDHEISHLEKRTEEDRAKKILHYAIR